ncbi:Phosducin-like protein [Penicillium hispanicum]|uniref:Phosducin-like protein n=1 Tax=Penicillium cinerascens TaxID=70096 RepID=A0A9W9JLU0_9EURO|nr:Phosducin-like protein [Penicillium hispanicum]XP_058307225.1 Phosducin-like protein [Penicillium cinerascens]KAJ5198797.1 Phosducin-like protein [Penicillium cinerascens]KAJ5574217.1 Phosducin-like protein [Penicillium hispanicum]
MQVEVNPNEDTEWNDILRQHGIIPEKPKDPEPLIQEALIEAERKAHENRLEDKDLDELDALEDEEDEDFLQKYRQKRLAELSTLQQTSLYNQVYPLQKVDYAREVTEASKTAFVLVNLTSQGANVESRVLTELWRQLATKYGDIKFCEIRADMCIEGYPERNTPTILIYKDTEIRKQLITLRELNGPRTKIEDLERLLIEIGALKESDVRLKNRSDSVDDYRKAGGDELNIEDYDDDWD